MDRNMRFVLLMLLAFGVAQTACALDLASRAPVSTTPTVGVVPATPTKTAVRETAADIIVGVWTAIDGALHLQFFSDGRFVRHYGGREDDPEEFWSEEGIYELGDAERLLINVPRQGPVDYEYRLKEPWLMLRDPDGRVMRLRRNVGLMETSVGPCDGRRT